MRTPLPLRHGERHYRNDNASDSFTRYRMSDAGERRPASIRRNGFVMPAGKPNVRGGGLLAVRDCSHRIRRDRCGKPHSLKCRQWPALKGDLASDCSLWLFISIQEASLCPSKGLGHVHSPVHPESIRSVHNQSSGSTTKL